MPEIKEAASLNLDDIALIGKVEKEFEKIKGYKVKMHTLNTAENLEVLKKTSVSEDPIVKYDILKRNNLIFAIDTINSEALSMQQKEAIINKLQSAALDLFYDSYSELLEEQQKILGELKKN